MRKFLVQGWYKDRYGWEDISEHDTREEAEAVADSVGCKGAHAMGRLWMPCADHPGSH